MQNDKFKIDFIGVGFSRCGTTWIAKCLREHPEICTPRWKEVHFFDFDYNYKRGLGYYKSFFKGYEGKTIGEYCPEYVFEEKAIQRIKKHFPNTKILVAVRNPYDRAFSHYLYSKRKRGRLTRFSDLFKDDSLGILKWSSYGRYLTMLYKYFDLSQVLVMNHDDSKKDAKKFIQDIYRFLDVDASFEPPSLYQEMNKSKDLVYRLEWLEHLFADRYKKLKNPLWRALVKILKATGVHKVLVFLRNKNIKKEGRVQEVETLSSEERKRLKEFYRNDIEKLEILLGKDFSDWRK